VVVVVDLLTKIMETRTVYPGGLVVVVLGMVKLAVVQQVVLVRRDKVTRVQVEMVIITPVVVVVPVPRVRLTLDMAVTV
tara:strand:+ start:54 stop:290 length:237 start_codon:yes stop_codon:yes gene_type:complete